MRVAVGNEMRQLNAQGSPPAVEMSRFNRVASERLDIEHLPVAVGTARGAGDVRGHFAAAFRAVLEDGSTPTVRTTAHFLTAFGLAALWYGHDLGLV
jgi:hypothetical protein